MEERSFKIGANRMRRKILEEINRWYYNDLETKIQPLIRKIERIKLEKK